MRTYAGVEIGNRETSRVKDEKARENETMQKEKKGKKKSYLKDLLAFFEIGGLELWLGKFSSL